MLIPRAISACPLLPASDAIRTSIVSLQVSTFANLFTRFIQLLRGTPFKTATLLISFILIHYEASSSYPALPEHSLFLQIELLLVPQFLIYSLVPVVQTWPLVLTVPLFFPKIVQLLLTTDEKAFNSTLLDLQ